MPSEPMHPEPQEYEAPTVIDLGSLTELTQKIGPNPDGVFGAPVSLSS